MVDETWPENLWPFHTDYFNLGHMTATYPTPFTPSSPQRVRRPGGELWRARLRFDRLDENCMGKLDALVQRLQGQFGSVYVINFRKRTPEPGLQYIEDVVEEDAEFPFSDTGFLFSDTGFGWIINPSGSLEVPRADEGTAAGATQLTTRGWFPDTAVLGPGDVFSLSGGRMHVVTDAAGVTSTVDGRATIQFRPPLRAAVNEGDILTVNDPTCRMRLLNDFAGIASDRFRNQGDVVLDFIEDPL